MDWSLQLATNYDSFSSLRPSFPGAAAIKWYRSPLDEPRRTLYLSTNYLPLVGHISKNATYSDSRKIKTYQQIEKEIEVIPRYREALSSLDLSKKIGTSIFTDFTAVSFASVDAVSKITGTEFTLNSRTTPREFSYFVLQSENSGVAQYLQYRYPQGKGVALPLKITPYLPLAKAADETDFEKEHSRRKREGVNLQEWLRGIRTNENFSVVERTPFEKVKVGLWAQVGSTYSSLKKNVVSLLPINYLLSRNYYVPRYLANAAIDNSRPQIPVTGNIILQWREIVSNVQKYAFFCAEYDLSITNEQNYQSLFLTFLCIALRVLLPGANMAIRIFVPKTLVAGEIIYLVSQCFSEITIVPACSITPSSSCYLLGKGFLDTPRTEGVLEDLTIILDTLTTYVEETTIGNKLDKKYWQKGENSFDTILDVNYDVVPPRANFLKSIFLGDWIYWSSVSSSFLWWFNGIVDDLTDQQLANVRRVKNLLLRNLQEEEEFYYPQFFTIWNLPDGIEENPLEAENEEPEENPSKTSSKE